MKSNELMIGNWVYADNAPRLVVEIHQDGVRLDSARNGITPYEKIEPLELTGENIMLMGYERAKPEHSNNNEWYVSMGSEHQSLLTHVEKGWVLYYQLRHCEIREYELHGEVHRLQNILAVMDVNVPEFIPSPSTPPTPKSVR